MKVEPYLYFDGRCEEALEFYKTAVNAQVLMLMRFSQCPEPTQIKPGTENKVMHASFKVGNSTLNASDGHCAGLMHFDGVSMALSVADDAEAARCFAALSDGGKVNMPLTKTFFSSSFGMVNDRFGLPWTILVAH